MPADVAALKRKVCDEVDRLAERLINASHEIHAHPELNFEEHFAHDLLTDELEHSGLRPERGAYGVATAFRADAGSTGPRVGVLCEYDALPEIGHACGHNIIATAGLGAGLALASVAEEAGGRVAILGTPAEEGGGGKIVMARNGAFVDLDAAMMVHPANADLNRMNCIAVQQVVASYEGRAAHAAAAPHMGLNALDAAVLGYTSVAALRQHILPNERLHGVFTKGGDKPNIVPKEAETFWYARSPTITQLQPLKARLAACLEAGAHATGCTCTLRWQDHTYSDMRDNVPMTAAYTANAAAIGRTVVDPDAIGVHVVGSTDMGNVSYLVPSIHPIIKVAPPGIAIHSPDFAAWARREEGDAAVLDGAKAMAMTVVDLWCAAGVLDAARADFGAGGPDRSVLA